MKDYLTTLADVAKRAGTVVKSKAGVVTESVSCAGHNCIDTLDATTGKLVAAYQENLKKLQPRADNIKENIQEILEEDINKKINKAVKETWKYIADTPELAKEKYSKMPKTLKVLAIAAMSGGAVVSIPFLMAMGPMSIVSVLATIGFGSLTAGGFGVAGGLIVTAGGATIAASLAGVMASKCIDDPEVNELITNFIRLEEIIKQNFMSMENHQEKYQDLYKKYAEYAKYVAELEATISSDKNYEITDVRDKSQRVKYLIEDLENSLEREAN